MKIRIYKSNLNSKYIIDTESGQIYNNLLVFSSTAKLRDSGQFSIYMILGYPRGTDNTIDIFEYFMDDNPDNENNIITKLTENIVIENNIFGYELIINQIMLISIPDEILFYNKNVDNEELVTNGNILNSIYVFEQNIIMEKSDQYYSLDYQLIVQEPTYDSLSVYTTNIINYPDESSNSYVDQSTFYEQKKFYGRTNTAKFKLCHSFCASCNKYGISNDNQLCLSCLDDYKYDYLEFESNCVPEGYFIDKEEGKLVQCTSTNSKFYNDESSGKRICFKFEYDCPTTYPYLNSKTNQYHNIIPPTTIPTTIPTIIPISECSYYSLLNEECSLTGINGEIYNALKSEIIKSYPSNGESIIIEGEEDYVFQITTSENELNTLEGE